MTTKKLMKRRLIGILALCLIISLSAVIINKFTSQDPSSPPIEKPPIEKPPIEKPPVVNVPPIESGETSGEKAIDSLTVSPEMLVLVNKQNELASDYEPKDLTKILAYAPGRDESARYMRKEAADQLNLMLADAKADGTEIVITTAYRAYWLQKAIFESNVAKKGSIEEANKTSAKPGQSEHQTGLAADLSSPGLNYEISYDFGQGPEGKWMADNAGKYGFILRYPKGMENITGYTFEPWHFRYVGIDAANYIFEHGLTLEEFLLELGQ